MDVHSMPERDDDPGASDLATVLDGLTSDARRRAHPDADGRAILRELIERVPVAALVANDSGEFVAVNARACMLTGYSSPELLRLSMWQITPAARDREAATLWRAFLETNEQRGDYRVLRRDGRVVAAEYAARAHVLPGLHVSLLRPQQR